MGFRISGADSGHVMGVYKGTRPLQALNNMAKDAGYKNAAEAAKSMEMSLAEWIAGWLVEDVGRKRT